MTMKDLVRKHGEVSFWIGTDPEIRQRFYEEYRSFIPTASDTHFLSNDSIGVAMCLSANGTLTYITPTIWHYSFHLDKPYIHVDYAKLIQGDSDYYITKPNLTFKHA